MTQQEVRRVLVESQALLSDTHVVYTSGRHGDAYINKDALYPDPARISRLCAAIAAGFAGAQVEVVAAPALGGIILSQWVAHHLQGSVPHPDPRSTRAQGGEGGGDLQPRCLAVYAEKTETGFAFRRGYDRLLQGRRVLVVEDILTTGASLRGAIEAVRRAGGQMVAAAALCNRGGVTAEQVGSPQLLSLVDIPLRSWEAAECPLCRQGVPVRTDVGKGRDFIRTQAAQ